MSQILLKRCRMVVVCGDTFTLEMYVEISQAEKYKIICTTLEGLLKVQETG